MRNEPASVTADRKACAGIIARLTRIAAATLLILSFYAGDAHAKALRDIFDAHARHGAKKADHSAWNDILARHLVRAEDGLNRFDYAKLGKGGTGALQRYLGRLQAIDPSSLTAAEQFAFWVNLYNAKTVEIVTNHYPVATIRDIRLGLNPFSGPWKKKLLRVSGIDLSLDDIEHEILRPVWKDPRIHYAANCASVGCPNLARRPYTGENLEAMLDSAARSYVNSPRGVRIDGGRVTVSSLYDWYAGDFGGSVPEILKHIRRYAEPKLAKRLSEAGKIDDYAYDWMLNDVK